MNTLLLYSRGWYPHWEAQLRAWNSADVLMYVALGLAMLWTFRTCTRGR
jgi:hypothetical protein